MRSKSIRKKKEKNSWHFFNTEPVDRTPNFRGLFLVEWVDYRMAIFIVREIGSMYVAMPPYVKRCKKPL